MMTIANEKQQMMWTMMQGTTIHWNSDSPVDWLLNFAHSHSTGNKSAIRYRY